MTDAAAFFYWRQTYQRFFFFKKKKNYLSLHIVEETLSKREYIVVVELVDI